LSKRKTRSDARIDALDPEQQEAVFAHCNRAGVPLEAGAKWLYDEFDVQISPQRLGKWLEKMRLDKDFRDLLSDVRADRDRASLLSREIGDAAEMAEANITMLGQALFETMRNKDKVKLRGKAAMALSMVVEAFAKDRKSKADVMTANTQRDKFQFDAAKAALSAAADLQEINRSKGSEREKVDRAIARLFGKKPENALAGMPEADK
jgi:hypothetical protein